MMNSLHVDHARALAADRARMVDDEVLVRAARRRRRAERLERRATTASPLALVLRRLRSRLVPAPALPAVAGMELGLPAVDAAEEL